MFNVPAIIFMADAFLTCSSWPCYENMSFPNSCGNCLVWQRISINVSCFESRLRSFHSYIDITNTVLIRTEEFSSYCKRAFDKITQKFKLHEFAMQSSIWLYFHFVFFFFENRYRFT